MARLLTPLLFVVAFAVGCSSNPTPETPSGALRLFLRAMDRSAWDPNSLVDAYGLLSPDARAALDERAERASTLAGREFEPWQMITRGRFRLRFAPREQGGMRERVDGDRAVVVVRGDRESERAEVPMVLEGEEWRVDLTLPERPTVDPDT